MKELIVLTTGGTIEKTYDESDGSLRNGPSIFRDKILSQLRLPHHSIQVKEVFSKDSLDIDEDSRKLLGEHIQKELLHQVPIVVIHGTDTMDLSAQYCTQNLKSLEVPVIFTGAMKPTDMRDSDALQNVAEAIYASQIVSAGVYISFHGCIYPGNKCVKNKKTMTFDSLN